MDDDLADALRALDCIRSQLEPLKEAIEADKQESAMICAMCIEIILEGVEWNGTRH